MKVSLRGGGGRRAGGLENTACPSFFIPRLKHSFTFGTLNIQTPSTPIFNINITLGLRGTATSNNGLRDLAKTNMEGCASLDMIGIYCTTWLLVATKSAVLSSGSNERNGFYVLIKK